VFLIIGLLLLKVSFSKLNPEELMQTLMKGSFYVAIPVALISLTGYYFRIKRWKIFLDGMGQDAREKSLYAALCVGYLVSFAIPRLGELSRSLIIKRSDNIRIDFSLLSIVAERVVDTFTLFILLGLSLPLFPNNFFEVLNTWLTSLNIPHWIVVLFWSSLTVSIFGIFIFHSRIKKIFLNYRPVYDGIIKSFKSPFFWIFTLLIWVCYFLMTWLWFWLYPETRLLSAGDALIVMLVGSFGRSMPVQGGGLGVYHFVVSRMLQLLGIGLLTGNAVAIIIHGAQAIITFVTGLISYLWLWYDENKKPLIKE